MKENEQMTQKINDMGDTGEKNPHLNVGFLETTIY
jgi:hypothetical protein